jgi:hypothetical protein
MEYLELTIESGSVFVQAAIWGSVTGGLAAIGMICLLWIIKAIYGLQLPGLIVVASFFVAGTLMMGAYIRGAMTNSERIANWLVMFLLLMIPVFWSFFIIMALLGA